jgi:hypothetical protein
MSAPAASGWGSIGRSEEPTSLRCMSPKMGLRDILHALEACCFLHRDSQRGGFLIQTPCWGTRPAWMTRPYSEDIREHLVEAKLVKEPPLSRSCRPIIAESPAVSQAGITVRAAPQPLVRQHRPRADLPLVPSRSSGGAPAQTCAQQNRARAFD